MAEWHEYTQPLTILTVEDISNIKDNMDFIKEKIVEKGIPLEELNAVVAEINTPYIKMFDLFQNIEYNLDILNSTSVKSIYWGEPKSVGEYAPNKEEVWRWLQILNELHDIVMNIVPKWGYLVLTAYVEKDLVPTIDGKKILIRGDYIG